MTTPGASRDPAQPDDCQLLGDHRPPAGPYDVSRMDDFQVIAERRRVMTALAVLTDQYRALNREITTRENLKWMMAR